MLLHLGEEAAAAAAAAADSSQSIASPHSTSQNLHDYSQQVLVEKVATLSNPPP